MDLQAWYSQLKASRPARSAGRAVKTARVPEGAEPLCMLACLSARAIGTIN